MEKVFLLLFVFTFIAKGLNAQNSATDQTENIKLDEIVVSSVRVRSNSSVANSNLSESEIKSGNIAKNIPAIIGNLPSVVAYTEGGTPVGNTSFRIRGTDANRINITLNGMPLNNPETQEVYWVNLPDLSNSLQSIQVQRGVGTASGGTASFGAGISLQTLSAKQKAYAEFSSAYGSYNTLLLSASAGTGMLKNGFSLDARYSYTKSDGYIRNGKVDHKNVYAQLSHHYKNQLIKIIYINGIQHTGITWGGVSPEEKAKDRRYNSAGKYTDDNDKIKYYGNETDNYYSHIAQLQYTRLFNKFTFNFSFGYNNGYGYYENYKVNQSFADFGLTNQTVNSVEYTSSDIIRRKLMKNNLYSANINLNANLNKLFLTLNTNYTYFDGDHYGKLLWIKYNENIHNGHQWYFNNSVKKDFGNNIKLEYKPKNKILISAELQARYVDYRLNGIDDDTSVLHSNNYYMFFNPKLGSVYKLSNYHQLYFSFGISNREPMRSDLKESAKSKNHKKIKPERLFDYELGYRYINSKISVSANLYYMVYKHQLIQTGKLSDTGYKFQENVPNSYRCGIELETKYNPLHWLQLDANITLSRNKIKNYIAYYYNYKGEQEQIETFKSTTISYSPSTVGNLSIVFKPFKSKDFNISILNKYVGGMFYDNTSNKENKLSGYFTTNFTAYYSIKVKTTSINLQLLVNNVFNKKYDANAWVETYKFADGSKDVYKGLFPQATTNIMGRISIVF